MLQLYTKMMGREIYQVSPNSTHMFLTSVTEHTESSDIQFFYIIIFIFAVRSMPFLVRLHVYEMR
jgi:hypothetical protein